MLVTSQTTGGHRMCFWRATLMSLLTLLTLLVGIDLHVAPLSTVFLAGLQGPARETCFPLSE